MRCPRRSPCASDQKRGDCPALWRVAHCRRGAAVVELAVLLPLLILLFVIAVDFSRAYFFSLTLQNCARAGAMYASDPVVARESPYANVTEAALADATNLSPPPTIATAEGVDAEGRSYAEVTATYPYRTVLQFPGIPVEMTLSRSVRMYYAAVVPDAT